MRAVVSRRHLLDGSGPFDRVAHDGRLFRLVHKKIVITYNDGSTELVVYSDVNYKEPTEQPIA